LTHFFVKLVFAAPCNFFSTAATSQEAAAASLSHFFYEAVQRRAMQFLSRRPSGTVRLRLCKRRTGNQNARAEDRSGEQSFHMLSFLNVRNSRLEQPKKRDQRRHPTRIDTMSSQVEPIHVPGVSRLAPATRNKN